MARMTGAKFMVQTMQASGVTALLVDPVDPQHIWAGIEVDGVRHSKDGGHTWEVVTCGVNDPDIHNLAITVGPPKTLLTITPRDVFSSTDNGATWEPVQVSRQLSIPYCRGVLVKADDPQVNLPGQWGERLRWGGSAVPLA